MSLTTVAGKGLGGRQPKLSALKAILPRGEIEIPCGGVLTSVVPGGYARMPDAVAHAHCAVAASL